MHFGTFPGLHPDSELNTGILYIDNDWVFNNNVIGYDFLIRMLRHSKHYFSYTMASSHIYCFIALSYNYYSQDFPQVFDICSTVFNKFPGSLDNLSR